MKAKTTCMYLCTVAIYANVCVFASVSDLVSVCVCVCVCVCM